MFGLIHILSGIALILFGVRLLREGIARACGSGLDHKIAFLAGRTMPGFAAGVGIGACVPSSTSVSMLLAQVLRTSRLSARAIFPIMLGADVGITALVLLTSLHISQAAPWLLVCGVGLIQFVRRERPVAIGHAFLGLAIILMGVGQIAAMGEMVAQQPDMIGLLDITEHYPVALGILAAFLAIALQSSTATILLVGSFGANSALLTLPLSLCVVIGANFGITLTRLVIAGNQLQARRLAVAALCVRAAVTGLLIYQSDVIFRLLPSLPASYGMKVAMLHVLFNAMAAVIGLIFARPIFWLAAHIVPADRHEAGDSQKRFAPRYIQDVIAGDTPSVALGQSLREILRAAEIVREMLSDLWQAMERGDEAMATAVRSRDDQVDLLDKEVKRFFANLANRMPDPETADEQMRQLRFLSEIEAIGDIVDKNLCELVVKKLHKDVEIPEASWRELQEFFAKVQENMLIAEIAFQNRDPKLAAQLLRHKQWLNQHYRQLADRQLLRLTDGSRETPEMAAVHIDLLTNLKRINSCLSHVAYTLLPGGTLATVDAASRISA
jgi:phosphate:Na+ symporter